MNLIMLTSLMLLATLSYRLWRETRIQETRWKLLALRDELRWLAIERPDFRESLTFTHLDGILTRLAKTVDRFSLWSTIGCSPTEEQRASYEDFDEDMKRWPDAASIFQNFGEALVDHLRARHWIIVALGGVFRLVLHRDPVTENAKKVAMTGTPSIPAAA